MKDGLLQLPEKTLVNIPETLYLAGDGLVSVRIENPDTSIASIRENFGHRLHSVSIGPEVLPKLASFSEFAGLRTRMYVEDTHMAIVGEHIASLRKCAPIFMLEPSGNLVRRLNFLTGFRFVVHIDPLAKPVDEEALMNALDFYLHNPILKTPVEPFHHLLQTISNGRGMTLKDLEFERPLYHFYVSNQGQISLSERYLRAGFILGNVDDTWEDISSSSKLKHILGLSSRIFEEQYACMLCSHYRICGALFKGLDPEAACDLWRRVFDRLENEHLAADELLRGHGATSIQ